MLKRLFDASAALLSLLLLAPIMAILALLIRYQLGSPILFRQIRPGKQGQSFTMYKFRTMLNTIDNADNLLTDAERLTPFGAWLRSTSLDELPELWNVLKGDMSLVGPRPLLMEYVPLYTPEQARRLQVRPGITGWAQVNGRNTISWEERFTLDNWYIDHQSCWLDLRILYRTIASVLKKEGISAQGDATMPRFTGSHNH
ncbi:MAG: sugar transferase [Pseudomonadota bacterium]